MNRSRTSTTFGFLHTADVHVATFTDVLRALSPDDRAVHLVDADLLTDARRRGGVDAELRTRIGTALEALAARGAERVVCTCSTIGGPAEELGRSLGIDVVRVDRPMAELAVAGGDRVVIVAALESTLGPTRDLLLETAATAGRRVTIVDAPCLAAWRHFEAGDQGRYFATLASHLETLDRPGDVIVLAQASMAPVEQLVRLTSPVLSSPRTAVAALLGRAGPTLRPLTPSGTSRRPTGTLRPQCDGEDVTGES